MAKAVLISIRPEWVNKILSGEKTLEVRKNRPNLETPFKCYIYCTNSGVSAGMWGKHGKVVGEFVCDAFVTDKTLGQDEMFNAAACMSKRKATAYSAGKPVYGWHISNLKIYDKLLGLDWFKKPVICHRGEQREDCVGCWDCEISRPPQSWCYVEEL